MDENDAIALNTSLAAARVLSLGAQRLSASLDTFSGWLLAGFGAVFGLLIANFSTLSNHISASSIRSGAGLFLIAAAFAAIQRLLAAYVAAGTAAGEDGRQFGKELASSAVPLDVDSMYAQVKKGLFWPLSSLNAWMTAKAQSRDYAITGRHHAKTSQIQFLFVVLQSGFSIWSAACVVQGIAI